MSTQTQHPWRATLRTAFAVIVGALLLLPALVEAQVLDPAALPWLAGPLAVAMALTRALAIPQVEAYLRRHRILQWLAAEPTKNGRHPADDAAVGFSVPPPPGRQAPHRGPSRDRSRPGKARIRDRRSGGLFLESDPNDVFPED